MWHRPRGSFKLYKESIIVLAIWSISGFHQICINKTLLQPTFVLKWILYVFHNFILNTPYLIIRSIFLIFAIYRSKVNISWRIKSVLRIYISPLNLLNCVQKALKNIQTKFHWDRMKHKTLYWSFKYMSNYHLKGIPCITGLGLFMRTI